MNEKIMLIRQLQDNFMLNAVADSIKKEGYLVECVEPNIDAILDAKSIPQTIIIYAGKYIYENMVAFNFLYDYCATNNLKVFIIGYENEIEKLSTAISANYIAGVFVRPLNTKNLVGALNTHFSNAIKDSDKKHILVVDDSGTMLRTIKSWLDPKYKVSLAGSATTAISFLSSTIPDLILLDYAMPVCSGPQFLAMIRDQVATKDIPVIFLTSKGDRQSVTNVLAYKPAGYLLKTMSPDEIIKYVDDFFKKNP